MGRPVFLDLTKIVLPYPAMVSICHRVSGVGIFFSWPFILPIIDHMLNPKHFGAYTGFMLSGVFGRVFLWLIASAYLYHICSGIRHFVDDWLGGQSLSGSVISAKITLFVAGLLIAYAFYIMVVV